MITLILPGFSAHNKAWAEECAQKLSVAGEIRPVLWDHWTDPQKAFDPKEKARILTDISKGKVVNIVAKSIGSLVACYIIDSSPLSIGKVILCGLPINDLQEIDKERIRIALKKIPASKILSLQNHEDPHGDFDQAKDFLGRLDSTLVIKNMPRSDHEYPYYDDMNMFLKS